jgi:hypothetical protein
MKLIESSWRTFLDLVVPDDADQDQIDATKDAYYAGAGVMFATIVNPVQIDGLMVDELEVMQMLEDEIAEFSAEVEAGAEAERIAENKKH